MRRRVLGVLASVMVCAEASAQPPGETPAAPAAVAEANHRYILLGGFLAVGDQSGGHPEGRGGSAGLEVFLGWAFGDRALMAWGRGRVSGDVAGFRDLGVAGRMWMPDLTRLYGELRAGYEKMDIGHWEGDFEGSPEREGAVVGAAVGFELVSDPYLTIDLRAAIDHGIILDTEDYTVVTFGLGVHIY